MDALTKHPAFLLRLHLNQLFVQPVPLTHRVHHAVLHVSTNNILLGVGVQTHAVIVGVARFVLLKLVEIWALGCNCTQSVVLLLRACGKEEKKIKCYNNKKDTPIQNLYIKLNHHHHFNNNREQGTSNNKHYL